MAQKVSQTTTDHETIRRWVEERGGWPAEVEETVRGRGETGILRIDFPGFSGEGRLRRISWDEWFSKFDESGLALVYQDTTADGQRSSFNKLVSRDTAQARAQGERPSKRGGSRRGARATGRAKATGTGRGASTSRRGGPGRAAAKRGGKRAAAKRGGGRRQAGQAEAARTARRGSSKRGASRRGASRRGKR